MIDLKINKTRLKNHFEYARWMYVIVIAAACVVFSMAYSLTKPEVPEEYRVDILVDGNIIYQDQVSQWSQEMLGRLSPDQQLVEMYGMAFGTLGYSASEILMARMTVGEDEIYILPYDMYMGFAGQQAFYDMTDIANEFQYKLPDDKTLEDYYVSYENEDGTQSEPRLYGLPTDGAMGLLTDLGVDPTNKVICMFANNNNLDNSIECVKYILEQNGES